MHGQTARVSPQMKLHLDFPRSPMRELDLPGSGSPVPAGLVKAFESECLLRRRAGRLPACLYVDCDGDRRNLRLLVQRGDLSNMVVIGAGDCLAGNGCLRVAQAAKAGACELVPFDLAAVDLVLCRVDLMSLQAQVVSCLLEQLRGKTRTGGMLHVFCSDLVAPLAGKLGALATSESPAGRRMFNALVDSGWSVLRTGRGADEVVFAVAGRP